MQIVEQCHRYNPKQFQILEMEQHVVCFTYSFQSIWQHEIPPLTECSTCFNFSKNLKEISLKSYSAINIFIAVIIHFMFILG